MGERQDSPKRELQGEQQKRKSMKYAKSGALAVIIAALLWSVDGLLRRHLYSLPAPVIVFWEHAFGFVLLLPFIIASRKAYKQLTRRQWYSIIGVSLLSGALGTILYTAALGRVTFIPFSVVVLLQQLNPIFAIGTASVLLRERLSHRFLLLSGLALIGAYFVSFPNLRVNLATGHGTLTAALLAVGAAACWGTATAFSKYALKGTSSVHITAARFGFTPLFALFFVAVSGSSHAIGSITFEQFKYLVAITFSTGLIALIIYYYGLQRVAASRAAVLELAWPLSAVVVGYLFLHQGMTATQIIGALILTATTYLLSRTPADEAKATSSFKTEVTV